MGVQWWGPELVELEGPDRARRVSLSNKALVASVGLERLVGLVLWLQPTVTTADVQVSQQGPVPQTSSVKAM